MQSLIHQQLQGVNEQFIQLFSSFDATQINVIPFKGSWTPAQVTDHVLKSEAGMVKALQAQGKKANRKSDARVAELKDVFLNFTTKLQSPDFILPDKKEYDKSELIKQFRNVAQQVSEAIDKANSEEAIVNPALGEITKEEIAHFLVYHTQRHIHQLQNIFQTLHDKTKTMSTTKETVIRSVNEAFRTNDMNEFLSYCTDDITWNMLGNLSTQGKDAILNMMTATPGDCPDIAIDIVFAKDDKAACTGIFSMKKGEGNNVLYSFCDIYHFSGDKIQTLDSYVVELK